MNVPTTLQTNILREQNKKHSQRNKYITKTVINGKQDKTRNRGGHIKLDQYVLYAHKLSNVDSHLSRG